MVCVREGERGQGCARVMGVGSGDSSRETPNCLGNVDVDGIMGRGVRNTGALIGGGAAKCLFLKSKAVVGILLC